MAIAPARTDHELKRVHPPVGESDPPGRPWRQKKAAAPPWSEEEVE